MVFHRHRLGNCQCHPLRQKDMDRNRSHCFEQLLLVLKNLTMRHRLHHHIHHRQGHRLLKSLWLVPFGKVLNQCYAKHLPRTSFADLHRCNTVWFWSMQNRGNRFLPCFRYHQEPQLPLANAALFSPSWCKESLWRFAHEACLSP